MTSKKRISAVLIAMALVFAMLFFTFFIAAEADHDCVGEGCAVCCQISVCENVLKSVMCTLVMAAVFAAVGFVAFTLRNCENRDFYYSSLVSLKVKLSD